MIALWQPGNQTMDSAIFRVNPGQAVLLFATGFKPYKYRVSAQEARVPQEVCVNRMLFDSSDSRALVRCGCDYVFDTTGIQLETLVDTPVFFNGCGWTLSACNNLRILAVPGYYRLHLNDATAIGDAQVYAEAYSLESLHSSRLFFSQE